MSEMQFRTAAIGGFNKQDVLAYIESSTRRQAEKLEAVNKELEELRGQKAAADERLEREKKLREVLEEENARLNEELKEREGDLTRAVSERDALQKETEKLNAQVGRLSPVASAYEGLKDRTAGIELEAHTRAQVIELEAQARAKKTQAELESWVVRLKASYDRLRADLDAALSHASGELARVDQSLAGIAGEFAGQDAAIAELKKQVESLGGPKAPEPLPLEERKPF